VKGRAHPGLGIFTDCICHPALDKIIAVRLRYSFFSNLICGNARNNGFLFTTTMSRKPGRVKRLFVKLTLIVLGVLVGSVIAEIALRVSGYSYPEFYTLDHARGYALRPGMEGWYRKEGEAFVRINSDGLRDREHSLTKAGDTIRIALVGDSYPEAFSVSLEDAFWAVMERKLHECGAFPGKNIEVINFGVSGYGTAQQLLTLREHVWKYSPDIVMLAFTTSNDIVDNSRELKKAEGIPYFVLKDNRLILDNSFSHSRPFLLRQSRISRFGRWLRDHSRLVQAAIHGHHGFKILLASRRAKRSQDVSAQPSRASETAGSKKVDAAGERQPAELLSRSEELGTDNLVYLEPGNAVWNEAWRITEELIVVMRNEVRAHGAEFVVVTLSNGPQVLPDVSSRENFIKRFGVTDLFYPDNRIKLLGAREKFTVLTLAPELQQFAERNHVYLHGFGKNIGNGHWNSTGHHVAGELTAKKICAEALLK
jgi:hypothetical protein